MQTLKLKYKHLTDEEYSTIRQYRVQYSHCLRVAYNRALEGWNENDIKKWMKTNMNNVPLMECHFIACAAKEGKLLVLTHGGKKVIFGGKKNFIDRCKGKITKEEFLDKRLSPLCSIGEANQKETESSP